MFNSLCFDLATGQSIFLSPQKTSLRPLAVNQNSDGKRKIVKAMKRKTDALNYLFAEDSQAAYQVWSDDKELGDIVEQEDRYISDDEKTKFFTPAPLEGLRERYVMWDFIRAPSTDLDQIKKRQDLLESLIKSDLLDQVTNLKNASYLINQGIEGLFTLMQVSEYSQEPAIYAYRHGHSELHDHIMSSLRNIKEGKAGLKELIKTLLKIDQPIIKDTVDALRKVATSIDHFEDRFFLEKDYEEVELSQGFNRAAYDILVRLGSMIEFANIIVRDGYFRAIFYSDKSAEYAQGWNFVREKNGDNPQVLNDSAKDNPITILCGANMGGKSFHLKQNFYMQLLAQSYGFVPAKEGNFRVYDSFLYLDRASTESYHDLSAYGVEIHHWVAALEKMRKKAFVLVDEGFSTTSAEDQYYLLMGIAEHLKGHGGRTFLATHNEAFINNCVADKEVGIYHFPIKVKKDGKVIYTFKLTPGPGDSRALEVAEGLGLPKKLTKLARHHLDGVFKKVKPPSARKWKDVKRYTKSERLTLKQKTKHPPIFKRAAEDKDRVFQMFTQDRDFQSGYFRRTRIVTGDERGRFSFGGWGYDGNTIRSNLIFDLLTQNAKLDSQEILERQKLFSELSGNDRYDELKEVGERLIWIMKFLPMFRQVLSRGSHNGGGGFLNFNTVLTPESGVHGISVQVSSKGIEYCIMFLRLNQKVLGENFPGPLAELLDKLEKARELFIAYREYENNQDIFAIQQGQQEDYDEEITDETIISEYLALAYDEPNLEKWQGKLTRRRIKEYLNWLKKHDEERFEEINNDYRGVNKMKQLIRKIMHGYDAISVLEPYEEHEVFNAQAVRDKFLELADEEPEAAKAKWQDRICSKRIDEYVDYLEQKHGSFEVHGKRQALQGLSFTIARAQSGLDIKDKRVRTAFSTLFDVNSDYNGRITDYRIRFSLEDFIRPVQKAANMLPSISIFECDLKSIAEEIRFIADYYKKVYKEADLDYYHKWADSLILILILEMFVDEANYFSEILDILRSYDSVYLHQMANFLEDEFKNITSFIREDRWLVGLRGKKQLDLIKDDINEARKYLSENKKKLSLLCSPEELRALERNLANGSNQKLIALIERFSIAGPPSYLRGLKAVFDNNFKEMLTDYHTVERSFAEIFARYEMVDDEYDIGYIRTILVNQHTTNRDKMGEVFRDFEFLTEDHDVAPYSEFNEAKGQEAKEIFRRFYEKEIIETGLFVEMSSTIAELDAAVKRAETFIDKYKIRFKTEDRGDTKREAMKQINTGNLWPLERAVCSQFDKIAHSVIDIPYGEDFKGINSAIFEIQALGLFGHMIKEQGFNPVQFNSNGSVNIEGMFSMFERKRVQVINDAHFGKDEFARLIAAPNMSGKTFYLKALTMTMLSALNTGFAPAESATMPLFDYIVYLDRVTTKLDRNLSALGNEVELWKRFFNILESNMAVFAAAYVDEAFSSTSPKYQASFVYAIVMQMIRQGQYLAIASHNHDVLDLLRELEKDLLKAYTLNINIDEEGTVKFDYKLKELKEGEKSFSEAIAVARTLGMPEDIIRTAESVKVNPIESGKVALNDLGNNTPKDSLSPLVDIESVQKASNALSNAA